MRSNSKEPVNVLWRSSVWLCAVLLPACPFAIAVGQYDAGTPITDVSITNPVASEVWLAGSDHTLTCTTATDTDRYCSDVWIDVPDSVTHYWDGTGTFQGNDNIGTSVTYICTDTDGNNTVTVYADDDYAPDNNTFVVDEQASTDSETVAVVIPIVDQICYGGGNHAISGVLTPEYDRSRGRNEPAAYTVSNSSITASVSFFNDTALTEASDVVIYGDASVVEVIWNEREGTMGTSWGASIDVDGELNEDTVDKITYDVTWAYKCPNGSDTYIDTTTQAGHVIYAVRTTPTREERIAAYDYSCTWCAGLGAAATDATVCDSTMTGYASEYAYDAPNGNCAYMASDYTHLIAVQGVNATQEKWMVSDDAPSADGQVEVEVTENITTLGNPAQVFRWGFHWWVTAGGQTRDPSAGISFSGNWGAYEDEVFDEYERHNVTPATPNPAGQATEMGAVWKMEHPAINGPASATFMGPPTPEPW